MGHAISYVAEAEIIHVHDETWGGIHNRYRREAMAFKRIYPQEHFRLWDMLRLWLGNSLSDMRCAAREHLLWREWRNILRFRWNQFSGTRQGYRSGQLTWQLKQTFYYPRSVDGAQSAPAAQRPVAPIPYADLTSKEEPPHAQ